MTCATNSCNFGVFRDHLCAPCYHRAEQQRDDLIRRKAAAFDRLERAIANGQMVTVSNPRLPDQAFRATGNMGVATGASLLETVEAMEERG